jgi:hypothetical protein
MKPATCGVKVVDVHTPAADGQVTGTFARVVAADPAADLPPVESYVGGRAPAGSFSFAGHRIRVRHRDGYMRRNDGEHEFSSRADDEFACGGEGAERLFVVLPALWAATETLPAAEAELRLHDDRLVLAYDAPNWQPGRPWKAKWRMQQVSSREQLVDARRLLNERCHHDGALHRIGAARPDQVFHRMRNDPTPVRIREPRHERREQSLRLTGVHHVQPRRRGRE